MSNGDQRIVVDHTLGNAAGYFIYITEQASESSGPAVMVTKPLHNSFLECTMIFWYLVHNISAFFSFLSCVAVDLYNETG